MKYCDAVYRTKRFKTREVMVGNVGVGGDNPVRIQSMTTSSTRDVDATVEQIIRLADVGCEIARVTVQGMKEAEACEQIKNNLVQKGYLIPVVADIHFFPPAAMKVVEFVDKVRVNPGNYVDKRAQFKVIEYDDESYAKELLRLDEKFSPLVVKCKTLKKCMRIGTNHGSLSDRIMNRYGDTPAGMVESALEFARVCRKHDFHDIIFSMKASNPQVMMEAYRLLVAAMYKLGWDYPLHLGVTEAGEGEDGRVKSAMGIGALLLDGLGDTIRVSLTEDPWYEIDPCQRLKAFAEEHLGRGVEPFEEQHRNIEAITRRTVSLPSHVSMHRDGSVWLPVTAQELQSEDIYLQVGCKLEFGRPKIKSTTADAVVVLDQVPAHPLQDIGVGVITPITLADAIMREKAARFAAVKDATNKPVVLVQDEPPAEWDVIERIKPAAILLGPSQNRLHASRRFMEWLQQKDLQIPVILNYHYDCDQEDFVIRAGAECGAMLCDGLGEGVCLSGPYPTEFLRAFSFTVLQSARMRTTRTDFISCPSCGRTLFNLQDVTARIRERTAHLPGVKIAIMGCIVNGPGEMADAHFGYVGSKPGKIDLYVGKECVEKDIDFSNADDRLVDLIKTHGRWIEPSEEL
ncbi:MAG: (E)-4-hydroxy-3-methylbut-2-enyl-diphosphate synthase [Chlamydiales bacterium]|nr:(E)-4-hydroxy-3-methylbut-2-enyl-diphosphate synthase [Chlamydiales bacterium]